VVVKLCTVRMDERSRVLRIGRLGLRNVLVLVAIVGIVVVDVEANDRLTNNFRRCMRERDDTNVAR